VKNLRKNNKFKIVIQIPCSAMIFVKWWKRSTYLEI
jgi:hypothetical protein